MARGRNGTMKECEKCPAVRRCDGKLVCGSSSSDNYDQYIERIDKCDVFGFNWPIMDVDIPFSPEECGMEKPEDDPVNHPTHYTNRQHECIDEMIAIFGKEAVIHFCICNAWKYRYRADSKGKHDEDMKKADWYINRAMELKNELHYDWIEAWR